MEASQTGLELIDVVASAIDNTGRVAAFLSAVFPRVSIKADSRDELDGEEAQYFRRWKEVQRLVKESGGGEDHSVHAESSTAIWTQLLMVYSLLISGIIAIGHSDLSRFHSGMTVFLVISPLLGPDLTWRQSSTLVVYAILGFCGWSHRLDTILYGRREHLLPRLLVMPLGAISLALVIFTSNAGDDHFSANPCESEGFYKTAAAILGNLLFIPYAGVLVIIINMFETPTTDASIVGFMFAVTGPFILLLIWVIWSARPPTMLSRVPRDVLAVQYPLLHFCGVFFIPVVYWILVNELRTLGAPDNLFSSSFGQVVEITPTARTWFMSLTFIRLVMGRRQSVPPVKAYSLEDGMPEKESAVDPFRDPTPEYQVRYSTNERPVIF
ncbi:hypothetical protein C8R44DRAFT_724947 [Mycena epipterygia]|nr:hypothetical protein C8R44DRAFT_724947 [Mycena epipterygia]